MTITVNVQQQFFGSEFPGAPSTETTESRVIRLPPTTPSGSNIVVPKVAAPHRYNGSAWTQDEHERFLTGLEKYPRGPWKLVAQVVGTRTTRQTMTHAQKYRQRIARHAKHHEEESESLALLQLGSPVRRPTKAAKPVVSPTARTPMPQPQLARAQEAGALPSNVSEPPPPELAAIEWLLDVYPIDFDEDLEDFSCLASIMLA
jgi:SHAQKYF class myb-like DNA-binding protein